MDGEKSHWLVETTLQSLARLTHRGAVAADGKSGDGCGIMLQFPEPFLRDVAKDCGFRLSDHFASGLVFFSPESSLIERGQEILTRHLARFALKVQGWRAVPTSLPSCWALAPRPSTPTWHSRASTSSRKPAP